MYHLLDYIGDVGGLFDGLQYICQAILTLFSLVGFNPLEAYLVNMQHKTQETDSREEKPLNGPPYPSFLCYIFSKAHREKR